MGNGAGEARGRQSELYYGLRLWRKGKEREAEQEGRKEGRKGERWEAIT